MDNLILILGTVAVTMSGTAMLALRRARQAGALCTVLESLLIDADMRLNEVEAQVSCLARAGKKSTAAINKLSAEQGRLAQGAGRTGFDEAIALIEHGANAEQLIETCRISIAEAHLVETLYRRTESIPLMKDKAGNCVLGETELKVA